MNYDKLTKIGKQRYDNNRTFFEHPTIKALADMARWTLTDPTDKGPISYYSIIEHLRSGAKFKYKDTTRNFYNASSNKPEDMARLAQVINLPIKLNNNVDFKTYAFHLPGNHKICVIDIESTCPEETVKMLLATPWLYAEKSMSGKGYHLIIEYPDTLFVNYPNTQGATTIKSKDNSYELHHKHWITFTGNMIKPDETYGTVSLNEALIPLFEYQAARVKTVKATEEIIDPKNIPYFAEIYDDIETIIEHFPYDQSKYNNDRSRWDFAVLCNICRKLIMLDKTCKPEYQLIDLTYEQLINAIGISVAEIFKSHNLWREKYETPRDNLPFLTKRANDALSATATQIGLMTKDTYIKPTNTQQRKD